MVEEPVVMCYMVLVVILQASYILPSEQPRQE